MTVATDWHEPTVQALRELLTPDPNVEALALVGSATSTRLDAWSDLDLLLVVRVEAFPRFTSTTNWLAPMGRIYAFEWHRSEARATLRICFDDLRRLDVIITTPDALADPVAWSPLLADGYRVLFSRTPALDAVLAGKHTPSPPAISAEAFETLANRFSFKGTVAVQKVVRGDLLVAFHLNLEMIQDCCVLAMMLRDRETGTTKHRGGVGNELVAELEGTRAPYTVGGILDSIEQSAVVFDRLAGRWATDCQARRHPLLEWVEAARRAQPSSPALLPSEGEGSRSSGTVSPSPSEGRGG
jgi:hypothetical protein